MAGAILGMSKGSAAKLTESTRRIKGQFASMGPELERANRASVDWLNARALKLLEESVGAHGRPQRTNGKLRNVFTNDQASSRTSRGFRWGVTQKLNSSGAGPYWRGVEEGTKIFVGRITHVIWIGAGGQKLPPLPGRYPSDARMLNDWDARLQQRGWAAKIKKPIVGYHFMSRAADAFKAEDVYVEYLRTANAEWRKVLRTAKRTGASPKRVRAGG
jgi:hypothetical protein